MAEKKLNHPKILFCGSCKAGKMEVNGKWMAGAYYAAAGDHDFYQIWFCDGCLAQAGIEGKEDWDKNKAFSIGSVVINEQD